MRQEWNLDGTEETVVMSSKDFVANRRPYISADKETSLSVLNKTSDTVFVIWLACVNEFRIRKRKSFRLGEKIRKKWEISSKRLPQQLLKLQELNFLTFETATGKAPLITSVKNGSKI